MERARFGLCVSCALLWSLQAVHVDASDARLDSHMAGVQTRLFFFYC